MSRRSTSERGAAVFIVVLVIMLLTGIGMFAVRSATLNTTAAGNERQMTQTHYVTEYGMSAALAELMKNPCGYVTQMMTCWSPNCGGPLAKQCNGSACQAMCTQDSRGCYEFGSTELGEIPVGVVGNDKMQAVFRVLVTDLFEKPGPGYGCSNADPLCLNEVTVEATGQLRMLSGGNIVSSTNSLETIRARVTIGPCPKK